MRIIDMNRMVIVSLVVAKGLPNSNPQEISLGLGLVGAAVAQPPL